MENYHAVQPSSTSPNNTGLTNGRHRSRSCIYQGHEATDTSSRLKAQTILLSDDKPKKRSRRIPLPGECFQEKRSSDIQTTSLYWATRSSQWRTRLPPQPTMHGTLCVWYHQNEPQTQRFPPRANASIRAGMLTSIETPGTAAVKATSFHTTAVTIAKKARCGKNLTGREKTANGQRR